MKKKKKKSAAAAGTTTNTSAKKKEKKKKPADPFAIAPAASSEAVVSEVRVERDAEGRIVRIFDGSSSSSSSRPKRPNPLNDPLNALDSDSEDEEEEEEEGNVEEWGGIDEEEEDEEEEDEGKKIVRQLEAQAYRPVEKKPRTQSHREREWVESMVQKHGDDVRAMVRDRVLNPMQQTEADITRRIRKWKGEAA